MTLRIGFFASHRGSNMQAVLDACNSGRLDAKACVVISNNSESEALARATRGRDPCLSFQPARPIPIQSNWTRRSCPHCGNTRSIWSSWPVI